MGPGARRLVGRLLVVAGAVVAGSLFVAAASAEALSLPLKTGARGEDVRLLQEALKVAGFDPGACDGVFFDDTLRAVKAFQKARGLGVDGIVGPGTWQLLEAETRGGRATTYTVQPGDTLSDLAARFGVSVQDLARANSITDRSFIRVGRELRVPAPGGTPSRGERPAAEVLSWDQANRLLRTTARVTDVRTGLSFLVKRRGGHLHADCEPATSKDAAIMKQAFGGSWSWQRRPIIVETGGRGIAASMNGMPHGGEGVKDNGFRGHFCIHFAGSRLHSNGRVDLEHQACVREAAGLE